MDSSASSPSATRESSSDLPVVVIGAGISGLTVAFRLVRKNIPVVCFEAGARAGGNIHTASHDGFLYDLGPDSFLKTKPEAASLCRDLGLEDELISPKPGAALVYVARDGALYPMPEGLSLGVPKRPGPLLATPLLSGPAKLRALLEPFVRRPQDIGEESILQFLSRRLGAEMAERLAAPLLSGVFAGDAARLSMDAAFPQLVALEKKYGSLFSGLNGGRSIWSVLMEDTPAAQSPFLSLRRGLGQLVERLVERLHEDCLHLSSPVERIEAPAIKGGNPVVVVGGERIAARHVVIAGPPWAARSLLGEVNESMADALGEIRGFATATVFFGLEGARAHHDFSGSGFIVPPGEAEILASTFISSKWEHRAPDGKVLIRAFVGGGRKDIGQMNEEQLMSLARDELTRLLGDLGPEIFSRVHLYERGTPQPELGFQAILSRIKKPLESMPWLSLLGSGYGGVGIPDCVRQADDLASTLAS